METKKIRVDTLCDDVVIVSKINDEIKIKVASHTGGYCYIVMSSSDAKKISDAISECVE